MTNNYLKLSEAPGLWINYPTCDACQVEVQPEDDWLCPGCGTIWPLDCMDDDGTNATLYADWSGEEPGGISVNNRDAWRVAGLTREDQERRRDMLGLGGE